MATFQTSAPYERQVLADVVVCRQLVTGSAELTIPAPASVTINDEGQLVPVLTVVQSAPAELRNTVVLNGQIINNGVLTVNVFAEGVLTPILQNIEVPWNDVVLCGSCRSADEIIKENFAVRGFAISGVTINGTLYLIITAAYDYLFICTQKQLISVLASDNTSCT